MRPETQALPRREASEACATRPFQALGSAELSDPKTAVHCLVRQREAYALRRLAEGRLSLSQAADLLDLSVYDVQCKAQEHRIELGATAAQYHHALDTMRQRRPKQKASKRTGGVQ